MKKIFAFLLFAICFAACDSISPNKNLNQEFTDTQQNKVIADLKFGMAKEDVDKKIDNFNNNNKVGSAYYIGDFKYDDIDADYHKGSLYKIHISGSYTDDGDQQLNALVKIIEKEYGMGKDDTNHYDGTLERLISRKLWYVGRKNIVIWLWGSTSKEMNVLNGGSKHVNLEIYLPDIYKKIADEEMESNSKQEKDKESIF